MLRSLPLFFLLACAGLPPGLAGTAGSRARLAPEVSVVPDCDVATACPDAVAGLDPERCLDDPTVFEVTSLDGAVLDATPNTAVVAGLGLDPGTWWAIWPDPDQGCAVVVHQLQVL